MLGRKSSGHQSDADLSDLGLDDMDRSSLFCRTELLNSLSSKGMAGFLLDDFDAADHVSCMGMQGANPDTDMLQADRCDLNAANSLS